MPKQQQKGKSSGQEIQSLRKGNGRRLKKLTVKDLQKPGKAAALDAKAAEVRHLLH